MYMDHKDLAYQLKNPLAKALDPAIIPNSVAVTAKSPSLRKRVRTVVLSGMASAKSTRKFGDLNYPTPGRSFYPRVIPKREILDASASILENG